MLRRILVALNGSPSSTVAQSLAIDIAKRGRAGLTGIGYVAELEGGRPKGALGGARPGRQRTQAMLEEAERRATEALGAFGRACRDASLGCRCLECEGEPAAAIQMEADGHDLIVLGRGADAEFVPPCNPGEEVYRLLRSNARPVLVSPESRFGHGRALVCFDGSPQASRAIHLFVLLGLGGGLELHVLSVHEIAEEAHALTGRASELFESHDLPVQAHAIRSDVDPAEILLAETTSLAPAILVMGAFGHTGFREFLVGSVTEHLLRNSPAALFVYH